MGRRLKRSELLEVLRQTRDQLDESAARYPPPDRDQDRAMYLEQMAAHGLQRGRLRGLSEAYIAILLRSRWGPVNQARTQDTLLHPATSPGSTAKQRLKICGRCDDRRRRSKR